MMCMECEEAEYQKTMIRNAIYELDTLIDRIQEMTGSVVSDENAAVRALALLEQERRRLDAVKFACGNERLYR